MPVSRFDSPVGQQYVSQYVKLPYEEISSIAKDYQHQYDAGRGLPNELDKLANALQATDYHQDYKNKVITKYHDDISKAMDEAKGNYASPDFQRKAMDIIYKFKNDKDVQNIQLERKSFDDYQQKYGLSREAQRDLNFSLPKDQIYDTHLVKHGLNVVPFAEHNKDAASYTEHMIPSSTSINNIKQTADGYEYILANGEKQTITPEQIKAIAQSSVNSYAGTAGGDFRMKKWVAENFPVLGPKLSGMGYEDIKATIGDKNGAILDNYLANDVETQGLQKIHSQMKYVNTMHGNEMAKFKAKMELTNPAPSTTPLTASLTDLGNMVSNMPEDLAKHYTNKGQLDLSGTAYKPLTPKEQQDIAKMGGWALLDLSASNSKGLSKNIAEYVKALRDNAEKITGLSKQDLAKEYNKHPNGYEWMKKLVEDHFTNISLQKNTIAAFQPPEATGATNFFVGDKERALNNVGASEITDMQGNLIDKGKFIEDIRNKDNNNGLKAIGIGFSKPGQIVIADENGVNYNMNTNYETLKKITRPVVEINLGTASYLKTFKLSKEQANRLGVGKKSKAPKFTAKFDGRQLSGEAIDRHVYKLNDAHYDAVTFVTRDIDGTPIPLVSCKKQNADGSMESKTVTLEDFKTMQANQVINSPEFRSINKEKRNPISFQ